MLEFGDIDGEFDSALRAIEPGKAVGDIEDGLAVGARQLDLRRIDAVRLHMRRRRMRMRRRGSRRKRQRRLERRSHGQGFRLVVVVVVVVGPTHELRRQHLGQVAGGADELRDSRCNCEDRAAAGATHLNTSGGGGSRRRRRAGRRRRRRRRRLSHGGIRSGGGGGR